MKFTCESCGAQYMIGDEKLGRRGVKVRCKKCSFVIILRPSGYEGGDKKGDLEERETGDLDRRSADLEPSVSLPPDAMAPTAPFAGGMGHDAVLPATSSDLGLSREFAAMGFEDEARPTEQKKNKSLSLGLDLGKVTPAFPDSTSPFNGGRIGGSLVDPQPESDEQPTRALGLAGLPRLPAADEEDRVEETSVDQRVPFARFGGAAADEELADRDEDRDDEEETGDHDQAETEKPFPERSDSTAPGDGAFAGAENTDLGQGPVPDGTFEERGTEAASTPEPSDEPLGTTRRMSFDEAASARIAAMDRDEMEDMESTLNRELDDAKPRATEPTVRAQKDEPIEPRWSGGARPTFGGLGALAAAETETPDDHFPALAGLRVEAEPEPVRPEIDSPILDSEIKNAFDAMFSPDSPSSGPPQPPPRGPSSLGTDSAPMELFRSAASYDNSADRRPTRIFDIEAMQQVHAEQELATSAAVPVAKSGPSDAPEWYVAINDEQVGPLAFADVRVRWENGEIGPASLCWKQGMPDWTAIKQVKELEALGDMDDRVRTVVAKIEEQPEPEPEPDEPPTIAMPEDEALPPAAAAVASSMPERDEAPDEPSWRPSAASALASLAAMELDEAPKKKEKPKDEAIGAALPATSDALEKLLQGDLKSPASVFGAAEQSSSAIRPLPKRTEIVSSSVSLRDPIPARARPGYLVPLAIAGGFVFLGICIILGLKLMAPAPQPPQMAMTQPPVTVQVNRGGQQQPVQQIPATTAAQQAGQVAGGPQPAADPTQAGAQAGQAAQAAGTTAETAKLPEEKPANVQASAEESKKVELAKTEPAKADATKAAQMKRVTAPVATKTAPVATATDRTAKKRDSTPVAATREAPPEPKKEEPPPSRGSEEDDLLGAAKKKTRQVEAPSSDLPKQLDDSDIMGTMRRNKAQIAACKQKQKSADPNLEGNMTVSYVIDPSGTTKRWSVSPEKFKSSVVGKCVIDAVKTWTFPRFSGPPMPVDFPLKVGG